MLSAIAGVAVGFIVAQTVNAAIIALSPPKNPDGFYGWFYRFARLEMSMIDTFLEQKYHLDLSPKKEKTT